MKTIKRILNTKMNGPVPEVTVEEVATHIGELKRRNALLIDVRRPDEYNNELGHIEGSILMTLGEDLTRFLENGDRSQEIVFICRSGVRSATATLESIKLGYKLGVNMAGGMLRWNELKLSIVRENIF